MHSTNRMKFHRIAAVIMAFLIAAATAPAAAQDGPTPMPTIDATAQAAATAAPMPTATPNQAPYKKQWDYEYRNSYLLGMPISRVSDNIAAGKRESDLSTSIYVKIFPALLANTPHKRLQKVRQDARLLYADLLSLDAQWAAGSIDAAAAAAKASELESRHKALLKAIERLFYERRNQLTEIWFIDLHLFALRRFRLWLDYEYTFDAMPSGFERVED
jgi:hypothetical protein